MDSVKKSKFIVFASVGIFAVAMLLLIDILIGMSDIGIKEIIDSIISYSGSKQDLIIRTVRLPRVLLCILIGASMAISGLIMQNLTRNPLASPQILGINLGATLSVVVIMVFFPLLGYKAKIITTTKAKESMFYTLNYLCEGDLSDIFRSWCYRIICSCNWNG